jgi:hypothetical protein
MFWAESSYPVMLSMVVAISVFSVLISELFSAMR